jgi:hypothetical protein
LKGRTQRENHLLGRTEVGDVGHSITIVATYRRYAAECVSMSRQRENINEKTLFLEMASLWLRLAEFAEKNEGIDNSPPDLRAQGGT